MAWNFYGRHLDMLWIEEMRRDWHVDEEIIFVCLKIFENNVALFMICKSLDVYLFSFFFQLRRRFKFVFASQHNSIVESCFRNGVNGDCKLLSNMFPHTVQRCSKNSQGRKLQRKRLLRSSHQNGPLFKLKNTTYKREKREDTFILFKTSKWVTFQRTYQ